jgi:biopolymer transport protein ExbB
MQGLYWGVPRESRGAAEGSAARRRAGDRLRALHERCRKSTSCGKLGARLHWPPFYKSDTNLVLNIVQAAGWPIWPLIICSIVALAIIVERFVSLRGKVVAPGELLGQVKQEFGQHGVSNEMLNRLARNSLLGRIFAAGLYNVNSSREVMRESIEEAGRASLMEMERFLTSLGTIATIAPLLGLLGTVVGLIEIFGANQGGGSPDKLAHGISVALYNTAFGLIVAIPSMIFYRYFRAKVEALVVSMEQQAIKLVEIAHGERRA